MKQTKKCICGHTHIAYVGDLGKNNDETGYDRISECPECECENFKELK